MLQLLSVTAPSLGSVANVTSYLSLPHHFNCFMDLSLSPSVSLLTPHRPPLDLEAPLLLHPRFAPLPFLSQLSNWTIVHSRQPPPTVPALAVFPPLTCSPGPCWPLQPHAASPFLTPLPLSSRPLFLRTILLASLLTTVGAPF